MLPQLLFGACLTAGAVLRRCRARKRNRRRPSGQESRIGTLSVDLTLHCRDLQAVLDVASINPRLLLTSRWQARLHNVARRISQTNGTLPWQLMYVYRQMESIVDTLSYDELYELFGGRPTPPAISRDEVRDLKTCEFDSELFQCGSGDCELRSDQVSCPVCLEDYVKGDKILILPNCQHVYHSKCVVRWLRSRGDCPICRCRVKEQMKAIATVKPNDAPSH